MFLLPTYSNPLTPYYFHVTRLASLHAILHVTWTAVFTIIPRRAVLPIVSRIDRSSDGFSYGFIDGGKGNAGRDRTVLAGWR